MSSFVHVISLAWQQIRLELDESKEKCKENGLNLGSVQCHFKATISEKTVPKEIAMRLRLRRPLLLLLMWLWSLLSCLAAHQRYCRYI